MQVDALTSRFKFNMRIQHFVLQFACYILSRGRRCRFFSNDHRCFFVVRMHLNLMTLTVILTSKKTGALWAFIFQAPNFFFLYLRIEFTSTSFMIDPIAFVCENLATLFNFAGKYHSCLSKKNIQGIHTRMIYLLYVLCLANAI